MNTRLCLYCQELGGLNLHGGKCLACEIWNISSALTPRHLTLWQTDSDTSTNDFLFKETPVQNETNTILQSFDPVSYVMKRLIYEIRTNSDLFEQLREDPEKILREYSVKLGIDFRAITPKEALKSLVGITVGSNFGNCLIGLTCAGQTCDYTCKGAGTCSEKTCNNESCSTTCLGDSTCNNTCEQESCGETCYNSDLRFLEKRRMLRQQKTFYLS